MLTSIKARGIQPFDGLIVDDLAHINLFVGANGTGKSRLLTAIHWLALAVDGPHAVGGRWWHGLSKRYGRRFDISGMVVGTGDIDTVPNTGDNRPVSPYLSGEGLYFEIEDCYAEPADGRTLATLWPVATADEARMGELVSFVRLVEPALRTLSVRQPPGGGPPDLRFDIGLPGGDLPLERMGSATGFMTRLGIALQAAAGVHLVVDDLGHNLHHSVLAPTWHHLVGQLRRNGTQLFASTSSYEVVQAAHAATADLRLFRLEHGPDGHRVVDYTADILATAFKYNLEIR